MPAVTLYRLKGGHTDLAGYVSESAIGQPKATGTTTRGKVALWRKTRLRPSHPGRKSYAARFPQTLRLAESARQRTGRSQHR